ncbi:MAG: hypothetical protein Q9202_006817 [Teloschistes flavicans]
MTDAVNDEENRNSDSDQDAETTSEMLPRPLLHVGQYFKVSKQKDAVKVHQSYIQTADIATYFYIDNLYEFDRRELLKFVESVLGIANLSRHTYNDRDYYFRFLHMSRQALERMLYRKLLAADEVVKGFEVAVALAGEEVVQRPAGGKVTEGEQERKRVSDEREQEVAAHGLWLRSVRRLYVKTLNWREHLHQLADESGI